MKSVPLAATCYPLPWISHHIFHLCDLILARLHIASLWWLLTLQILSLSAYLPQKIISLGRRNFILFFFSWSGSMVCTHRRRLPSPLVMVKATSIQNSRTGFDLIKVFGPGSLLLFLMKFLSAFVIPHIISHMGQAHASFHALEHGSCAKIKRTFTNIRKYDSQTMDAYLMKSRQSPTTWVRSALRCLKHILSITLWWVLVMSMKLLLPLLLTFHCNSRLMTCDRISCWTSNGCVFWIMMSFASPT